jgi:hypothetical protein
MIGLLRDGLRRLTGLLASAVQNASQRFRGWFRLRISMTVDAGIAHGCDGSMKPLGNESTPESGPREVTATQLALPKPASHAIQPFTRTVACSQHPRQLG